MFDRVHIKNFQSHKDTTLDLAAPGVNVIVGPTDSGKSALFRAMVWTCFNRPSGDAMRAHWAGKEKSQVTITMTDGTSIKRSRGKSTNEYFLNDMQLKAFGTDPPDEIMAAHQLDRKLNVQTQIDPFFLLQSTPGEVATYFNQVASLEEIDSTTRRLNAYARSVGADISRTESDIKKRELDLQDYNDLPHIEDLLDKSDVLAGTIDSRRVKVGDVLQQISLIEGTTLRLEKAKARLAVKPLVIDALALMVKLGDVMAKRNELLQKINVVKEARASLGRGSEHINVTKPLITEALSLLETIDRRNGVLAKGWQLVQKVKTAQDNLAHHREQVAELRIKLHDAMPEGSACPLCGQLIPTEGVSA